MKTDAEVQFMVRERRKGKTQEQAAARTGMSVSSVRRYERRGKLPPVSSSNRAPIAPALIHSPSTGSVQ